MIVSATSPYRTQLAAGDVVGAVVRRLRGHQQGDGPATVTDLAQIGGIVGVGQRTGWGEVEILAPDCRAEQAGEREERGVGQAEPASDRADPQVDHFEPGGLADQRGPQLGRLLEHQDLGERQHRQRGVLGRGAAVRPEVQPDGARDGEPPHTPLRGRPECVEQSGRLGTQVLDGIRSVEGGRREVDDTRDPCRDPMSRNARSSVASSCSTTTRPSGSSRNSGTSADRCAVTATDCPCSCRARAVYEPIAPRPPVMRIIRPT